MVPAVQHRDASIGGSVTKGAQDLVKGVTKPDAMGVASSKAAAGGAVGKGRLGRRWVL